MRSWFLTFLAASLMLLWLGGCNKDNSFSMWGQGNPADQLRRIGENVEQSRRDFRKMEASTAASFRELIGSIKEARKRGVSKNADQQKRFLQRLSQVEGVVLRRYQQQRAKLERFEMDAKKIRVDKIVQRQIPRTGVTGAETSGTETGGEAPAVSPQMPPRENALEVQKKIVTDIRRAAAEVDRSIARVQSVSAEIRARLGGGRGAVVPNPKEKDDWDGDNPHTLMSTF